MEIDVHYSQLNDNISAQALSWVNKYILYFPMFVIKTPNNHPRPKILSIFINLFCFAYNFYHFGVSIWWILNGWFGKQYFGQIMYVIQELSMLMSRNLSIIYYYKYFHYPWMQKLEQIDINNHSQIAGNITKSSQTSKFLFVIIISSHLATFVFYGISDYLNISMDFISYL